MPGFIDVGRVEMLELAAGDPAVVTDVEARQKVRVLVAIEKIYLEPERTVDLFVCRERLAIAFGRFGTVPLVVARPLTGHRGIGRRRVRRVDGLCARREKQNQCGQRESIHAKRGEQMAYPNGDCESAGLACTCPSIPWTGRRHRGLTVHAPAQDGAVTPRRVCFPPL